MCDGYNATEIDMLLDVIEEGACKSHFVHPATFEWAVNDLMRDDDAAEKAYLQRGSSKMDDCRTCKAWKLDLGCDNYRDVLEGMAARIPAGNRVRSAEYGIYGGMLAQLSDGDSDDGSAKKRVEAQMHKLYKKGLEFNGTRKSIDFVLTEIAPQLEHELETMVARHRRITPSSKYASYWCKRAFRSKQDVERFVEKQLRPDGEDPYNVGTLPRIRWISEWPVSVAIYEPGTLGTPPTLALHEWLIRRSRRVDILILALHEIAGHHHQEARHRENSSAQAESCAMSCERLVSRVAGNEKAYIEWRCARLCRALLDIRLHLGYNVQRYPNPEYVWRYWDKKFNGPFKFIIPLPSETLRVAALPGQALGYVPVAKSCPKTGCPEDHGRGCNPVCATATNTAGNTIN